MITGRNSSADQRPNNAKYVNEGGKSGINIGDLSEGMQLIILAP